MTDQFDRDRMLAWARHLYDLGPKRPGSEAGVRAEEYLCGLFCGFGIADVRCEPVDFTGWFHHRASLTIGGAGGSMSLPVEPIVYTSFTPDSGISAPVVDLGAGAVDAFEAADLSGKIALVALFSRLS